MSIRKILVIIVLLIAGALQGQKKQSKADILFFEYAYNDAIAAYEKEMTEAPLTNQQRLNLADSYLKMGRYKNASETYLEVYRKDSTMSTHHFNKMLQSMAKTSGPERTKAFLATKQNALADELLENAAFNATLLGSTKLEEEDYNIFSINANSPQSDFAPTFYGDKVLFSSGRPQDDKKTYAPTGEGYLDIFVGKVGLGGQILNPNPFDRIPKSKFHEATPYYSEELNGIFYIRSNANKGKLSFDENGKNALSIGLLTGSGTFQYLLRDLSTSFYYPFFDAESGRLYFAANFEDSLGGTDLYYVNTNNGLIMSAPISLGPRINTPGNEIAPYIFEGSLYFSSDIFYGLGGMDIYKSEIGEDDFFSIPVNLGDRINSKQDDFGFIIKENVAEGYIGYFASNRPGGMGNDDIYGILSNSKPGLKTLVFRGELTKANSSIGVSKALIRVYDPEDELVQEVYSREDGSYRMEIPWQAGARISISKPGYSSFGKTYDKAAVTALEQSKPLDLELTALEDVIRVRDEKTVVKMNKFFFAKGAYEVTADIGAELDKIVEAAKDFPQLRLRIEAHTDSRGGRTTNLRLSQRRADAIKNYLLSKDVPSVVISEAVGYGENQITNNCRDGVYCIEVLHKQNERYLAVVLNEDELAE
ncbi:OmpA family protein [Poritiphilus flavus]|uniref:OmpA family protein n=1 Tax=Poritiphilus flavus TaxID=2697053 RepID=A0A6L9EGG1_9FLAO|nr:OmpA family protein [Poritiphilus flavus]NAS13815.1 OmpA family protein [Poritiphilus flavus]